MKGEDSAIVDIYCQKLASLNTTELNFSSIANVLQTLPSIHVAFGESQMTDFWQPLLELVALLLEN